jgi:hypothetical protein
LVGRDRRVWSGLLGLALACALAAPALASEPIESFVVTTSSSHAGGHPDLSAEFALKEPGEPEAAISAQLDLPAGQDLVPLSVPGCMGSDFGTANCPAATQIGFVTLRGAREGNMNFLFGTAAVYNLVPASGELGRIGFVIPTAGIPVEAPLTLRSESDYGLRIKIEGLPPMEPLGSVDLRLWGVPADPSHDASRLPKGTTGCPGAETLSCNGSPVASPAPLNPLTIYPVRCLGSPSWNLDVRTSKDPETPSTRSTGITMPTHCDQLSFNPSTDLSLGSAVTGSATGMDLAVHDPLTLSPTTLMPSPLFLSATNLHGLVTIDKTRLAAFPVCSAQEAKVGSAGPASCPEASTLGTSMVYGPLLPEPISGALYYGGPVGNGAYVIFLTASGHGLDFKTGLLLEAGGAAGATLLEASLPQLPISEIQMKFSGGPSSILRTGSRCGPHTAKTLLVPWNALTFQLSSNMVVFTRPGGAVCAEEAAAIDVEADPPSLPADGASTGTVTATIADESEVPVIGDEVDFEASDPNVAVGPVVDNEDGTYTASVTASTTPHAVTVTVTDREVEPPLKGATAIVLAPVAKPQPPPPGEGPPPPPATPPRTTIGGHPPRRGPKHRATFDFSADVPGSTFSCKLDSKPYRSCSSPLRLTGLKPGRHMFRVFATGPSGLAGTPASFGFTVKRPPAHHRASHAGR